jgi:hypothetical protein
MGLTAVLSDLLDVGDMADVGGQVGIVQHIGIRFTELINFSGAKIFIPNRTITSVINYPNGYVRVFLDVRLPNSTEVVKQAEVQVKTLAKAAYEQFPGIILLRPMFFECEQTVGGSLTFGSSLKFGQVRVPLLRPLSSKTSFRRFTNLIRCMRIGWLLSIIRLNRNIKPRSVCFLVRQPCNEFRRLGLKPVRRMGLKGTNRPIGTIDLHFFERTNRVHPEKDTRMSIQVIHLLAGLVVLLFGRKLFWLFVGYVGFVMGYYYTTQILVMQPGVLVFLIAIGIGILGTILATFLQKAAILVSGFLAGGYVVIHLFTALGGETSTTIFWLAQLIGGVIGAIVLWAIFDYALIVFSAVVGASALITANMFHPQLNQVLFFLFVLIGIIVQTYAFRRKQQLPRG